MKRPFVFILSIFFFTASVFLVKAENRASYSGVVITDKTVLSDANEQNYWLFLARKSNVEYLYLGVPGDKENSQLIKEFKVKTGVPVEKPTPLPQLLEKDYWLITDKWDAKDNPDTAPYFLKLDIPVSDSEPYGPSPYLECNGPVSTEDQQGKPASSELQRGKQCNWDLPGYFGLHGVNGNTDKLSENDPGSSGCIRHTDEDITYLYSILNPSVNEVRYYIGDI